MRRFLPSISNLNRFLIACLLAIGTVHAASIVSFAEETPANSSDLDALPEQVSRTRILILEAAKSGEVENLRPVLEMNELMPTVTFGGTKDPIAFWKQNSSDGKAGEILAVMSKVLELPYARVSPGSDDEIYVWPYLAELPPNTLSPDQKSDLLKLVSAEEAEMMKDAGSYIYYRLGIGRDGTWHYFVAGD